MGGRYTDYPEHLNPFREEDDGDDYKRNKFATLGRRKLKAVLNLTSWGLFPWRRSKADDSPGRHRFLAMTPKLSRHLLERLSKRKPRSASLSAGSHPATSTQPRVSYADFRIMPRSCREKFAVKPAEQERQEQAEEAGYLWADLSSAPDLTLSSASTSPISEVCGDTDARYTRQGARPKKKRPAPPPPAGCKHVNTSAETQGALNSPTPPLPMNTDADVSIQDTPPASPTSKITTECVHEMSVDKSSTSGEVPSTSPSVSASAHETSPETSPNVSVSVHETFPETSPSVSASIHKTSPEKSPNISASVRETSPETSPNASASVHETSPETSPSVSASVRETSPETLPNARASVRETSPETSPNISASVRETSPETSPNISASVRETSPETSPNVSVSVREASPARSPTPTNANVSVHETSATPNSTIIVDHGTSPSAKDTTFSIHETLDASPPADNLSASVHETLLETSKKVSVLLQETPPDDHRDVNQTTCKL